jgi:RNA polymerase sigma-70 factor (ECF subfamily)
MILNVKSSADQSAPDPELDPLIAAVLAGDREAYREVILRCEAKVRVILAAILPDKESVDDLAQEVFVTAYGKLRDYRPGSDFVAWLKAITRNLALNERRRWLRHQGFKQKFQAEMETALDPFITSTAERFEGNVLEALRDCLAQLHEPARRITEDFYFHGQSTDHIARRLNRERGWVRLALFRARSGLAACLQLKRVI